MHQLEPPLLVDNPLSDAASADDVDTDNFEDFPVCEYYAAETTANLGTLFKQSSPDPCLCVFDLPECYLNEYSLSTYNQENALEHPSHELTFRPVQFSGGGISEQDSSNLSNISSIHSAPPSSIDPVFAPNDTPIYLSTCRNSKSNSMDLLKINTNSNGAGNSFVEPHNIYRHQSLPSNSLELYQTKDSYNEFCLRSPIHEIPTDLTSTNNHDRKNSISDLVKLIDLDILKGSKIPHSTTTSNSSIGHRRNSSCHKNLSHITKPKVKIVNVGQMNHNATTKTKVKVGNPFYKPRYKSWSA